MDTHVPCTVVAELCCNHMGDYEIACKMIRVAKASGADYAKFQKRNPEESVPEEWHTKPHPNPRHAFGVTYLEHRQELEFDFATHCNFQMICNDQNIGYACSVWDVTSAREIISLNPDFIKVPSAANTFYQMLDILFNDYKGDIHISLGMMTKKEKEQLFTYLEPYKQRTVVYHAVTEYPVPFERMFLLEIKELKKVFPRVGFSGHHLGISADISAFTLGAEVIERHFTLDRTWLGSDQAASIEPQGLSKLCRDLKAVQKALSYRTEEMTDIEKQNREKLKIR